MAVGVPDVDTVGPVKDRVGARRVEGEEVSGGVGAGGRCMTDDGMSTDRRWCVAALDNGRPMSERLRIGIVGAGGITRARHVPGFRAIPGVELHGVVNRSPASTAAAAHELGIGTTYPDWHALVADPGIDAVVVATWPYLHAPVTIAALEAGKHVLTQARMAMDADEARLMLRASLARPDLVAMVVPSPLSFWCDATIQRLLAEGTLGELRHMTVTWDTSGPAEAWRLQRRWSGHNVMALGIVYESIARWLGQAVAVAATGRLRAPIRQVPEGRITADVLDDLTLLVEFPGGLDSVWTMTTGLPLTRGQHRAPHRHEREPARRSASSAAGACARGRKPRAGRHPR